MAKSIILPATPVDVTRLDGTRERVLVRRLAVVELYTFVELLEANNEPELVRLCTGRDRDWLSSLTDESFGDLVKGCVGENFRRAMELAAKGSTIAAKVIPLARRLELVAKMAEAMAAGLESSASSAASAPSPDGPGSNASRTPSSSSSPSSASTSGSEPVNVFPT